MWNIVSNHLNEMNKKERVAKLNSSELLLKLNALESNLGEEYYIFVQMKTLQLMVKEINQLCSINLEKIKNIFESIIRDEDHHREILATIKEIGIRYGAKQLPENLSRTDTKSCMSRSTCQTRLKCVRCWIGLSAAGIGSTSW